VEITLAKEKVETLAYLGGLFSGRDVWSTRESASASGDEVEVADADAVDGEVGYEIVQKEGGQVRVKEEEEDVGAGEAGRDEDIEQEGESEEEQGKEGRGVDAERNGQALSSYIQHNNLKDVIEKSGMPLQPFHSVCLS
jgi:hypothetical protein